MRNLSKYGVAAAIAGAMAITALPHESQAGVMSAPDASIISPPSSVEQIHFRRHHHYRHWRYSRYYYPPYYYNPAAAVVGAAASVATAPFWGWGYPYYYHPWW